MLNHTATLNVLKNNNNYQLLLPPGTTLGEIHDVLFEMREFISQEIHKNLDIQRSQKIVPLPIEAVPEINKE